MATKVKTEKPATSAGEGPEEESSPMFEASRKVLLAAIGAVALAQDEMEDFVKKLVERGEIAENDGKKLVREVIDRRMKTRKGVRQEANKRLHEALSRMNIPTKDDINELNEKISILTRKIEELKNK